MVAVTLETVSFNERFLLFSRLEDCEIFTLLIEIETPPICCVENKSTILFYFQMSPVEKVHPQIYVVGLNRF